MQDVPFALIIDLGNVTWLFMKSALHEVCMMMLCVFQVCEWADGKERNIRALISSLHTILWEGETRWNECGMHQLIQPDQVGCWTYTLLYSTSDPLYVGQIG